MEERMSLLLYLVEKASLSHTMTSQSEKRLNGPMGKGTVLVGDMWLNQDQLPSETTLGEEAEIIHGESSPGVKEEWRKWPNRILYYQLSRRLPTWAKNDIKQA